MGKRRIALYFGSFNPVHRGHVALAEMVLDKDKADEVVLVVSPQNPHKIYADLAPELMRFEMCELACAASKYPDRIRVSAIEFTLERPSYTINTLRYLTENFGEDRQFILLLGADNIATIDTWYCYREILRDYPILVYPRQGCDPGAYADGTDYLESAPLYNYSATMVREALQRGESISHMVSPEVEAYIEKQKPWRLAESKNKESENE